MYSNDNHDDDGAKNRGVWGWRYNDDKKTEDVIQLARLLGMALRALVTLFRSFSHVAWTAHHLAQFFYIPVRSHGNAKMKQKHSDVTHTITVIV